MAWARLTGALSVSVCVSLDWVLQNVSEFNSEDEAFSGREQHPEELRVRTRGTPGWHLLHWTAERTPKSGGATGSVFRSLTCSFSAVGRGVGQRDGKRC